MHTQCGEDNNGGDEEDASHAGTPAKEPHHNGKQCKKKCSHTPYSPPYDFSLAGRLLKYGQGKKRGPS